MTPRFLKVSEAVTYSGKSRTALYIAMSRNEITARKSGKITLIDRESLDRHLDNLPRADIKIPSAA
ncbi:MAG: helix-turn-helix domain-containing protein [Rhodospirillales bacterium]|nr:helix-turn-helix domain-containing protein [Rhodospirillales bacterium]